MSSPARPRTWCTVACATMFALCVIPGAGPGATAAAGLRLPHDASPLAPPEETRALWVLRTSLASPATISTLVRTARENSFNTLLVQVRGRGDAYFGQGLEPRAPELIRQPDSFDPLASVITQAHEAGLQVHAWVNVGLVSGAVDLPAARGHVVYRHPAWLMVPRDIAQRLSTVGADSPGYLGALARWTRTQSSEVEGLYLTPLVPASAAYTESIVRDLARRYAVDGVHFDYVRFPSERFDYSSAAIAEFRATVRPTLAAPVRGALDAGERVDLFAYPDGLPEEWRRFRVSRLSSLVARLGAAVRQERPAALVTVAAAPDLRDALDRKLQDWKAWLADGLVDAVCPMAYTPDPARFAEQIAAARQAAGSRAVWAGIGAYRLSPSQTIENIQTARRLGANGIVLFSYDSLTNPRQVASDYLPTVARGAFAADPASQPAR